jgi:molybdopterin converting factor small subunit
MNGDETADPTDQMTVHVRAHAGVSRFFPGEGKVRKVAVTAGSTVGGLLLAHGVPEDLPLVVGLNRDLGSRESQLQPGDLVELVPPMTGGQER